MPNALVKKKPAAKGPTAAKRKKPGIQIAVIDPKRPPEFVSPADVSRLLGVAYATVIGWMDNNLIGCFDLPPRDPTSTHRLRRIPWQDYLAFKAKYYRSAK